jgi:hypothetical protein
MKYKVIAPFLSLLYNGYRDVSGGKAVKGVTLTTHPHLKPRLKKE